MKYNETNFLSQNYFTGKRKKNLTNVKWLEQIASLSMVQPYSLV